MFPSYRNKSVDLLCKSTDWFQYDGNIGRLKVKTLQSTVNETLLTSYVCHARLELKRN